MPEYQFVEEGGETYCYLRGKKHLVAEMQGVRFLIPMSIATNKKLFKAMRKLLTKQAALYKELIDNGVPVQDAVKALAISSMFSIEFAEEKFGDLLLIKPPEGQ